MYTEPYYRSITPSYQGNLITGDHVIKLGHFGLAPHKRVFFLLLKRKLNQVTMLATACRCRHLPERFCHPRQQHKMACEYFFYTPRVVVIGEAGTNLGNQAEPIQLPRIKMATTKNRAIYSSDTYRSSYYVKNSLG